jgi:hypothetical protein
MLVLAEESHPQTIRSGEIVYVMRSRISYALRLNRRARLLYLSPEFKQVHAIYKTGEIQDLVDRILALAGESAAVAILEGTGTYSYFWKEQLQKKGIFADGVTTPSEDRPVADLPNSQLKKDGVENVKWPHLLIMFSQFYQNHLEKQLKPAEYQTLQSLVYLLLQAQTS